MTAQRHKQRIEIPAGRRLPALDAMAGRLAGRPFAPHPAMRNGHAMTILGKLLPRKFGIVESSEYPGERREFETEPGTRVVAYCHWQQDRLSHPTVMIIHGLEGSAEASYVLGVATKAWEAGFNVLRYNVRGCGGTERLSPKLYHSGLTVDLDYVVRELIERDGLPEICLTGISMGGNQSLKFAGELGDQAPRQLRGVCAISPPISLEPCAEALMQPRNRLYEAMFLRSLKRSMRRKDEFFPGVYDLSRLDRIRHLWEWDDVFQQYNGFRDARDYYARASALPYIPGIRVPALIIHAQDDPFIPIEPFRDARLAANPSVLMLECRHGGHVAFCGIRQPDEDRAWAENRAVEFCRLMTETPKRQVGQE
ncbi:MAG: alpha/beta fold hydrolase [Acidobacteriota bacterium]|nr:MAG: alpha/beta fold hydrolase [Acidobacteriota bacterium]